MGQVNRMYHRHAVSMLEKEIIDHKHVNIYLVFLATIAFSCFCSFFGCVTFVYFHHSYRFLILY